MRTLKIKSKVSDYRVNFGSAKLFLSGITSKYPTAFYIIDKKVWNIYHKSLFKGIDKTRIIKLEIGENKKNLDTVQMLYGVLSKRLVKRNLVLVSIGGGITQDITGFLASSLYRGIKWIFIPTTLLAQCDSCIGSKTSLNYRNFKNLVGTFYPPSEVYIDINFINSQNSFDFYSGLGEIVKLHITGGRKYVNYLIKKLKLIKNKDKRELMKSIYNSLLIKKGYIEVDEFDKGRRNLLNYGHSYGHALETATNFDIPHGQAIAIGMIFANIVAVKRGLLSETLSDELTDKLLMPVVFKRKKGNFKIIDKIISAMKKDKKRTGDKLPLIVLKNGFKLAKLNDLTEDEIMDAALELDRKGV